MSTATLYELTEVMMRPRFAGYLLDEECLEFLDGLSQASESVDITEHITVCRDPKDDKFLELAISGNATHIVRGDPDLLEFNPFRGIPVLTTRSFMEEVQD